MISGMVQGMTPSTVDFIATTAFIGMVLLFVAYFTVKSVNKNRTAAVYSDMKSGLDNAPSGVSIVAVIGIYVVVCASIAVLNTQAAAQIMGDLNPITLWFMGVILALGVYFHIEFTPLIVHKAPATLTTFGILGTFIGIAIGLAHFDVNDVAKSVPALIDGIKTAFWSSAVGIFCALTLKLRDVLFGQRIAFASTGINDIIASLKSIETALVGNQDASLMTQNRLTHKETLDRLDKLNDLLTHGAAGDKNPFLDKSRMAFKNIG